LLSPGLTSSFTEDHGWRIGFFFNIYFGVNVIVKVEFAQKKYAALATIRYQLSAAHNTRFDK